MSFGSTLETKNEPMKYNLTPPEIKILWLFCSLVGLIVWVGKVLSRKSKTHNNHYLLGAKSFHILHIHKTIDTNQLALFLLSCDYNWGKLILILILIHSPYLPDAFV